MLFLLPQLYTQIIAAPISSTLAVIYMGVFPGAISYLIWSKVLESMDVSQATGYIYTIAYLDDVACGYSAVKIDRGVFLSKFYVLQSERGRGVGKALMDNIVAIAGQHKRPRIWLTCNKHNPSLSVYKKMNFIIIDEVVTDIGGGYVMDDYVLEKKL